MLARWPCAFSSVSAHTSKMGSSPHPSQSTIFTNFTLSGMSSWPPPPAWFLISDRDPILEVQPHGTLQKTGKEWGGPKREGKIWPLWVLSSLGESVGATHPNASHSP